MQSFITRANVDHYLELLKNGSVPSQTRSAITTLLIEEEDKLGHDYEQLEFVESRATACRVRADRQRRLMDSFNPGSDDWVQAERLLVSFESLAQLVEVRYHEMRHKVNNRSL